MRQLPEGKNWHHIWWMERNYKTHLEKRFRSVGAFVIPTIIEVHADYHANEKPPKKPTPWQMQGVLRIIPDSIAPLADTIELFQEFSHHPSPEYHHNAQKIADNLTIQQEYFYGTRRFEQA